MTTNRTLEAAQDYIQRGWPVLPIKPGSKLPLTLKGVTQATTDERTVLQWFDRWPDAGVGIACGSPGPDVVDIDDMERGAETLHRLLQETDAPYVATSRGRHLYFKGTDGRTVNLGFGEVRRKGSYVIAPPSLNKLGQEYVWLQSPEGLYTPQLPALPDWVDAGKRSAGVGAQQAVEPGKIVGAGERHAHLQDLATRLLRSGVTDPARLEVLLRAEYENHCVHEPPIPDAEIKGLASWGATTEIAGRERVREQARKATEKLVRKEPATPEVEAAQTTVLPPHTTDALRAVVDQAGGWSPASLREVLRFGADVGDALVIILDNGTHIRLERHDYVTRRGKWRDAILTATHGRARPQAMKDEEAGDVLRSLCLLASQPSGFREVDDLYDAVTQLLSIADEIRGYSVGSPVERFRLITEGLQSRPIWDPFDRGTLARPALVVDEANDKRYVRAGELRAHLSYSGLTVAAPQLAGRAQEVGLRREVVYGRQALIAGHRTRKTATTVLYEVPWSLGSGEVA